MVLKKRAGQLHISTWLSHVWIIKVAKKPIPLMGTTEIFSLCLFTPYCNFWPNFSSILLLEVCQKLAFSSLSQLIPLFPETYGHPSLSFIHQTKPNTSYFEHLKFEPDLSTYAREKGGVKIVMDCGTPCISKISWFMIQSAYWFKLCHDAWRVRPESFHF